MRDDPRRGRRLMMALTIAGTDWAVIGVLALVFIAVLAFDLHERRRREP